MNAGGRLIELHLDSHPAIISYAVGDINARVSLAVIIAPIGPAAHLSIRSRNSFTQHVYLILFRFLVGLRVSGSRC